MTIFSFSWRRFPNALFLVLALAGIAVGPAVAQETSSSRQLERIDVEAPARRPAARTPTSPVEDVDYDQVDPSAIPSREDRGAASDVFSGSGIPSSTLSLVTDKSRVSIGAASLPAQVQQVTAQDLAEIQTWGETSSFLRRVPGVRSYFFDEGPAGVAMAMRGFYSAREIGIFIDGVPMNVPSSLSGTGRVLMNWLDPELIEKIEVIKGPFSALYGDFAMAGVINIVTKKSDPSPSLKAYGGNLGLFRAFGVLSSENTVPIPFLTQNFYTMDGYRENAQQKRYGTFNKVSVPTLGGVLSLRWNYFQSSFGIPGYVPISWVKSGQWPRRRTVDPMNDGNLRHYQVVMNYAPSCGERGLYGSLYVDNFDETRYVRYSPLSSSQTGRTQERTFWGGRAYYHMVFGEIASLTVGGELKHDKGDGAQFSAVDRQMTKISYDYGMQLSNWAMFLQGQIKPAKYFKVVGGVRWDWFKQSFDNVTNPQNSGTGYPYIRSPKIGVVLTPTENFNIFGNLGCGFRSPANTEVSPYQTTTNKNFELEPALVQTYDVGCNFTLFGRLYFAADYYHTYTEREIRTVDYQPVNVGSTLREGYELETRFYPGESPDVSVFASYAWVDATVPDPTTPGRDVLTGISEHLIKGGVSIHRDFGAYGKVLVDLDYEYNSGVPGYLSNPTTLIYAPDWDVYNLKLRYEGNGWSSFLSVQCQPREYAGPYTWADSNYRDHVYTPTPKWQLASGLKYAW